MRRGAAALVALVLASGGCRKPVPPAAGDHQESALQAVVVDASTAARCHVEDGANLQKTQADGRSVIGAAVQTANGLALGQVRTTPAGVEAIVSNLFGGGAPEPWLVATGAELIADAPPPIPLVANGNLYAAYLTRDADAGAARRIAVKKSGAPGKLASFKDEGGDSLSFDAATATDGSQIAVVWDDDARAAGGIRIALVATGGGAAIAPRVVSDGTTDVDEPRVIPRASGGWWVAWVARREENPDAGSRVETPGEAPTYAWLEMVAVDAAGVPAGPIRKLTPANGHVASFDLAMRPHGEVDVFVRDETQAREGEGGTIAHLVASESSLSDPVGVATGAGRGAIDLVTGPGAEGWLSFIDAQDRPRLVPLDASRAVAGPPSVEETLEGARILAVTSATTTTARFALALGPPDTGLFRESTCNR